MRKKIVSLSAVLGAIALAGSLASCATDAQKEAKLQAEAKVSRAEAEKIALTKVPGGTVKEAELEKEKGKLIWSFDIATTDSKDITEVEVDAMTGEVVAVEKESPKDQKKEKD